MDIRINQDTVDAWKEALSGDRTTRFIWVLNDDAACATVPTRITEMPAPPAVSGCKETSELWWIVAPDDVIVTKRRISQAFQDYVHAIRSFAPRFLPTEHLAPTRSLLAGILVDDRSLDALKALKLHGAAFIFFTLNDDTSRLSQVTEIPIATCTVDILRKLDDKRYGRRLCRAENIRIPTGVECDNVGQLRSALNACPDSIWPLLVKKADGNSGLGHVQLVHDDDAARFLETFSQCPSDFPVAYVVERLVDHAPDANFSFRVLIGGDGKLTLTDLHREWIYPPKFSALQGEFPHGFSELQVGEIMEAAEKIGIAMYRDGYRGTVGIDGLVDRCGQVYPVLDINPRPTGDVFTISLTQQYRPACRRVTRHTFSAPSSRARFGDVKAALIGLGLPSPTHGGVVIQSVTSKPSDIAAASCTASVTPWILSIATIAMAPDVMRLHALATAVDDALKRAFGIPSGPLCLASPPATYMYEGA